MSWLLWREYRTNCLIVYVGLGLFFVPYLFLAVVLLYRLLRDMGQMDMSDAITVAAMASIALSQLTLVLLGGNAIAGERADRSAEFVAHLPISRRQRVVSKIILSVLAAVLVWGGNLLILLAIGLLCGEALNIRAESRYG